MSNIYNEMMQFNTQNSRYGGKHDEMYCMECEEKKPNDKMMEGMIGMCQACYPKAYENHQALTRTRGRI